MKKKGLAPGGISWSAWKLHLIVVSLTFTIVLCMLAFLSLQRFSPSHSQLPSSMLSRRSLHSYLNFITPHEANPKVAFLFLACRHLPLDFLWNCFLQGRFYVLFMGHGTVLFRNTIYFMYIFSRIDLILSVGIHATKGCDGALD
ncbi:hypothetical protein FXO38_11580 [Capsicum annuum]|nr:hypothetical protein FXO37_27958 [Capsicum annuum]KAF3661658.1 hypothetical protein FXO38_11580 [Capsicum annuum]